MRIDGFIWIPAIIEKLAAKHEVTPEEVEEVFFDSPRFRFHEKGKVKGEDMYTALGQTASGRYLIVFFILKINKLALTVSARDMDESERKRYAKK